MAIDDKDIKIAILTLTLAMATIGIVWSGLTINARQDRAFEREWALRLAYEANLDACADRCIELRGYKPLGLHYVPNALALNLTDPSGFIPGQNITAWQYATRAAANADKGRTTSVECTESRCTFGPPYDPTFDWSKLG